MRNSKREEKKRTKQENTHTEKMSLLLWIDTVTRANHNLFIFSFDMD